MKKRCPACHGYPTRWGETTRPPELSRPLRRVCKPYVNGLVDFARNKLKVTSSRVTRGEGCLGYPRPYMGPKTLKGASLKSVNNATKERERYRQERTCWWTNPKKNIYVETIYIATSMKELLSYFKLKGRRLLTTEFQLDFLVTERLLTNKLKSGVINTR